MKIKKVLNAVTSGPCQPYVEVEMINSENKIQQMSLEALFNYLINEINPSLNYCKNKSEVDNDKLMNNAGAIK